MRPERKSRSILILAGFVMIVGILVFLYPAVSSYLAMRQQEQVIVGYEDDLLRMTEDSIKREWRKAEYYNQTKEGYMEALNTLGNGVMGYIDIPKIKLRIPVYHSANEASLKKGAGHLEGTGLPIGGGSNRPVLMGHRGLPEAELFTRLDELEEGDLFHIHVLNQVLTYEVREIEVVLPEIVEKIQEEDGYDLVTLVTCTPYGVNTHRLLVTGERIDYEEVNDEKIVKKELERNKLMIYLIILFTGVAILVYPHYLNRTYNQKVKRQEKLYFHHVGNMEESMDELYGELLQRNQRLYNSGQKDFRSVQSYQRQTVNLKEYGIYNNTIGYISIPVMKIKLPIYLGATEGNMKKGAVHLTETSYPIGGDNTNCVIAAHRGYSKAAMFREIEKLKKGDKVYIENFKECLTYEVKEIQVILPTETKKVLIQAGKDMVTLMTCHPYRKNSHRYVVFCERI